MLSDYLNIRGAELALVESTILMSNTVTCSRLGATPGILGATFGSLVWILVEGKLYIAHEEQVRYRRKVTGNAYLSKRIRELHEHSWRYTEIGAFLGVNPDCIYEALKASRV